MSDSKKRLPRLTAEGAQLLVLIENARSHAQAARTYEAEIRSKSSDVTMEHMRLRGAVLGMIDAADAALADLLVAYADRSKPSEGGHA